MRELFILSPSFGNCQKMMKCGVRLMLRRPYVNDLFMQTFKNIFFNNLPFGLGV